MKAVLGLSWFAFNGCLLWAMTLASQRLLHQFMQKYPEVAEKEIPYVFEGIRHPEQFLYFYRQRAAKVLKHDEMLLKLRRRLFVLTGLALVVPILSLIALTAIIRVLG